MIDLLQVNQKKFKKVIQAANIGMGVVLGTLAVTGNLISSFPITGIGEFVISAPSIVGVNFSQMFSISILDVFPSTPATMIKLDSVKIEQGFRLTKRIDLTYTPMYRRFSSLDFTIFSPTVHASKLAMISTGLQSRAAQFNHFSAIESAPSFNWRNGAIDPPKQLGLSAANIDLNDAKIITDALRQKTLMLGIIGTKVEIATNPPLPGRS